MYKVGLSNILWFENCRRDLDALLNLEQCKRKFEAATLLIAVLRRRSSKLRKFFLERRRTHQGKHMFWLKVQHVLDIYIYI